MQLFFPPHWLMIILFIIFWFAFQAGISAICFYLPDELFMKDTALYRSRSWEKKGTLYEKITHIKKWKHYLPDGGAMFGGYAKKHLQDMHSESLERFLLESRRAELTHWLAIFPFWVFGLFAPWYILPIMLLYALAVNLPCIIVQRYNRPRIRQLQYRMVSRNTPLS